MQTVWTQSRPDKIVGPDLGPNFLNRFNQQTLAGKESRYLLYNLHKIINLEFSFIIIPANEDDISHDLWFV